MTNRTSETTNTTLNNLTNASNSSQSSLPVSISSTPNVLSNNTIASPINISACKTNLSPYINGITYNGNFSNANNSNNNTNNDGVGTCANDNYINNTSINLCRLGSNNHDYCGNT